MSLFVKKLVGVGAAVAVAGRADRPVHRQVGDEPAAARRRRSTRPHSAGTQLTLETVAAIGPKYSPSHPDWVSYLVRRNGQWVHSTIYTVPANSIVHVTVYQYDGDSGLRNPFLSQVAGHGRRNHDGRRQDGQRRSTPKKPRTRSWCRQLGVFVPLPGVAEEAKNQCEFAPCEGAAHRTINFSFRTGKKGRYRWQCFVPCAAGFLNGFGGPMQTLGYMDGFSNVV